MAIRLNHLLKHLLQPSIQTRQSLLLVDSGASMRMMSKMDLSREELETVNVSRRPTTVITANGSDDTTEEVTFFLKDLDMFVPVQLLEDTPAGLWENSAKKMVFIHTSGTKVNTPILSKNNNMYFANATISCPSVSLVSQVKHTSRVQQKISAETTKESKLDDQETTKASRHRWQDLPERLQEIYGKSGGTKIDIFWT